MLGRAGALTVGYFTDFNAGTTTPAAAITTAGHTPVQILNISTFDLSTIDMLMIDESNNGGLSGDMSGRLADIAAWVDAGHCMIVHDRFVGSGVPGPNPFLIGAGAGIQVVRDFSNATTLDFVPPGGTLVQNGPGGVLNDNSLDGGNFSTHGFAIGPSIPVIATEILALELVGGQGPDLTKIAAFSYPTGLGHVYYSTSPLDFYLDGNGNDPPRDNFRFIYAPNVIAYMADLCGAGHPQTSVPEPGTLAMLASAGALLVRRRRRRS